MTGPERANVNSDPRNLFNVVAQWKLTDLTVFTLDAVYGSEKGAVTPGETASWSGIAGYARFGLSDTFALCLRAEYFNDPDGARTGVGAEAEGGHAHARAQDLPPLRRPGRPPGRLVEPGRLREEGGSHGQPADGAAERHLHVLADRGEPARRAGPVRHFCPKRQSVPTFL